MTDRSQNKNKNREMDYHSQHQRQENSRRMEQRRYQSQGHLFHPTSNHSQQQRQHEQQQQQHHFDDTSMMDHRQNYRRQQQRQQQTEVSFLCVFQKDNKNRHESFEHNMSKKMTFVQINLYIFFCFIKDGT